MKRKSTWYEKYGQSHPVVHARISPGELRELEEIAAAEGLPPSKVAATWLRLGLRRYRRNAARSRGRGLRRIIDRKVNSRPAA